MALNEKTTKEELFDEINVLYEKYVSLLGKENVENKIQTVKSKILIALYKVYVTNSEKKEEDVNYNSYADEILTVSAECLKVYEKSSSSRKVPFSKYACSSIKNRLNFLKKKEELEQNNGGMCIPEDAFKLAKKIKILDEYYEKFGFKGEEIRDKKISFSMEIHLEKVRELKLLWKRATVSQIQTNEGEEYDAIDAAADKSSSGEYHNEYFARQEKILEWKEQLELLFEVIQSELKKKFGASSEELSDFTKVLTVDLCRKHFPHRGALKKDGKDGKYSEARKIINEDSGYVLNMENLFRNAGFLDLRIINQLFTDENYRLPEMQELALECGYKEKSGLTKKITRFYDDVVEACKKTGCESDTAEKFLKA